MKKYLFLVVLFVIPSVTHAQTLKIPPPCVPYVKYVKVYDWDVQTAINVMWNESGCQPEIVNLTDKHYGKIYPRDYPNGYCFGSFGLFQTNCNDVISYDPAINIAVAYQIYKEQGWLVGWRTTCTTKVKCKK